MHRLQYFLCAILPVLLMQTLTLYFTLYWCCLLLFRVRILISADCDVYLVSEAGSVISSKSPSDGAAYTTQRSYSYSYSQAIHWFCVASR